MGFKHRGWIFLRGGELSHQTSSNFKPHISGQNGENDKQKHIRNHGSILGGWYISTYFKYNSCFWHLLTVGPCWTDSNFKRGTYFWCHPAFERGPEQSAQWSNLQWIWPIHTSTPFNPFRPIGFGAENKWKLDFSDFKSLNSRWII